MKLTDLMINQNVSVQFVWEDRKIEFNTIVAECGETEAYIWPYIHNGSPLELNITPDKDVICNIYTNDPVTGQRISWKNIELTTVLVKDKVMYCIRTYGFNNVAEGNDRRINDRNIIQIKAKLIDGQSEEGTTIVIYDISDSGVSFYVSPSYMQKTKNLIVEFTDKVFDEEYKVKVDCTVARITTKEGNKFIGCRILNENKDYRQYNFMKKLMKKKVS